MQIEHAAIINKPKQEINKSKPNYKGKKIKI